MFDVGNVCLKIAGRDAGRICVVIKKIDVNNVMIDGETRRRKCNINHLELLNKNVEIKEDASTEDIVKALVDTGLEVKEKKKSDKVKDKTERPKKQKKKSGSSENKKKDKPKKEDKKPEKEEKKVTDDKKSE